VNRLYNEAKELAEPHTLVEISKNKSEEVKA
jgi:hypothetical protein